MIKKKFGTNSIFFLGLAAFLLLSPFESWALKIDRPIITADLGRSQTYSDSVTITNPTSEAASVLVYLEDFLYVYPYDGAKEFMAPGLTPRSISAWLKFSPQQFTVEPFAQKTVNVVVQPAEDFDTVHCGVLFFETSMGTQIDETGKNVKLLGRLGALIYINPKTKTKKVEIKKIGGDFRKIKMTIADTGNMALAITGTYYFLSSQGVVGGRGTLPELYFLPGNEKEIEVELPKALKAGQYTFFVNCDLQSGDVMAKEIDFTVAESGMVTIKEIRD